MEKTLQQTRDEVADQAFAAYDFDADVVDSDGWSYDTPGNEMTRRIYIANEDDPDGDSISAYFTVRFTNNTSADLEEAYAITRSGNIFGHLPDENDVSEEPAP